MEKLENIVRTQMKSTAQAVLSVGIIKIPNVCVKIFKIFGIILTSIIIAGHLAFTMAVDSRYILPMIVGKLVAGTLALGVAWLVSEFVLREKRI